jgi:uncharacterized OB-fold protein
MAKEKVIPVHMIPDVGSEVLEVGNERFLQTNEAMFTVRVPPFELHCPECDFAELELIKMPDTGVLNSTPPITYFAHSLFQHQVPFGRGRVLLKGADTALPIHVYTTKGVLTPRIFKKGTPVKVVFRDKRVGKPTDIFATQGCPAQEKGVARERARFDECQGT